jgi:hypothetical protein
METHAKKLTCVFSSDDDDQRRHAVKPFVTLFISVHVRLSIKPALPYISPVT